MQLFNVCDENIWFSTNYSALPWQSQWFSMFVRVFSLITHICKYILEHKIHTQAQTETQTHAQIHSHPKHTLKHKHLCKHKLKHFCKHKHTLKSPIQTQLSNTPSNTLLKQNILFNTNTHAQINTKQCLLPRSPPQEFLSHLKIVISGHDVLEAPLCSSPEKALKEFSWWKKEWISVRRSFQTTYHEPNNITSAFCPVE